jgi:hypothetical protein
VYIYTNRNNDKKRKEELQEKNQPQQQFSHFFHNNEEVGWVVAANSHRLPTVLRRSILSFCRKYLV